MQRWEYLTLFVSRLSWSDSLGRQGEVPRLVGWQSQGDPTELLNQLGDQGWELVGADDGKLYLKRPRQ